MHIFYPILWLLRSDSALSVRSNRFWNTYECVSNVSTQPLPFAKIAKMKVSDDTYGSAKIGLLKFSIYIVPHVPLPHLFRPIQNSLRNKNPYHAHLAMSLRVGSKPGKFAVFQVSWLDPDLRITKEISFFYRAPLRSRSTVPSRFVSCLKPWNSFI